VIVKGRARRSEFWWFYLFLWLAYFAFFLVDIALGTEPGLTTTAALFVLVGSTTASVRRMHDTDRSGWWYLVGFIPLLGLIWLIVLLTQDGTPGINRFGPSPKSPEPEYASGT
jgi:uncharacterized membrane protein YhaH (DUF805 family)